MRDTLSDIGVESKRLNRRFLLVIGSVVGGSWIAGCAKFLAENERENENDSEGANETTAGTDQDQDQAQGQGETNEADDLDPIPEHEDVQPTENYTEPPKPAEMEKRPREAITIRRSASTTAGGREMLVMIEVTNTSDRDIDAVELRVHFYEGGHYLDTLIRTINGLRAGTSETQSVTWDAAETGVQADDYEVEATPMDRAE